jgi:type IV secretory pathway VirB10-like protein
MEAIEKEVHLEGFKNYFLKEPKLFTSKREVNWSKVQTWAISFVAALIIGIMVIPSSEPDQETFYEKAERGSLAKALPAENDPTQETIRQLQESQVNVRQIPGSLDYLYRLNGPTGSGSGGRSGQDRSASMILSRGGTDARTQLSAGTRVSIRLSGKVTMSNQGMPVVGIVSNDVSAESGIAIPSGSKVLGDASFDEESERASISWRSIILPDGRERPFSAIGVNRDGQVGVNGKVHSDGVKNAVGQTLTRFVGAYAAGSMNTGAFGANQGGNENGLRNAVAQTATDRANAMGEELQKERKWIKLQSGAETFAVLNQPFTFRDAGATYGR